MRTGLLLVTFAVVACGDPMTPRLHDADLQPAFSNGGPPEAFDVTFVIDWICSYPLEVQLDGKEKFIVRPNGSFIVTAPRLWTRLTNLDTGATTVESVTGAITVDFRENGDAAIGLTGRNLVEDETGLFITVGTFTQVIAVNRDYVQPLQGRGRTIDVCALLS